MTKPFFNPWVGQDYSSGGIFGKRIMVLGESHYCSDMCPTCGADFNCECNEFTTNVVKIYLDHNNERESWMNTFLKFERSLVNHETTPEESLKIWNSLLFYNYLQTAMPGARVAGTTEQYKAAEEPFFSVLEQYQPDLLIVWGVRLWDNMPWEHWEDGVQMKVDDFEISNGFYELSNGKKVRAVCVYHPSSGYSWDYWYKVISQLVLEDTRV